MKTKNLLTKFKISFTFNLFNLMKTIKSFKQFGTLVAAVAMAFCNYTASAQDISVQAAQGAGGLEIIPGQYIVKMKSDPNGADLAMAGAESTERPGDAASGAGVANKNVAILSKISRVNQKSGVSKGSVIHEFSSAMVGFSAKLTNDQVKKLRQDPEVEGVYPDYVIKLAPVDAQGPTVAAAQFTPCGITKAGGPVDGSTKATWIWILDTGIDYNHPDLNVQTNATYAKSFIAGQTIMDGHSHGTHCAGIAAAKNNTFGVVGVSAGAKVVPVKVLSNAGSGSFSGIIAGLNHVASKKIAGDVVSMSIGAYPLANCENSNPVLRDVIRNLGNAGVWVVMAAGNDGNKTNGTQQNMPGCINGTRVLTVGAIDCNNNCASYTNLGAGTDWVAVGSNVYSTIPGGGYGYKSGTSMATPTVAGICHARNNYPVSAGSVNCGGRVYPIARR